MGQYAKHSVPGAKNIETGQLFAGHKILAGLFVIQFPFTLHGIKF